MKKLVFFLVLGMFLRIGLSVLIYSGDLNNHMGWGWSILTYGFKGAYDRSYDGIMQPTYPPLALYSFTTADGLYRSIYSAVRYLNQTIPVFPSGLVWLMEDQDVRPAFHKIISEISDLGIAVLVYALARIMFRSSSRAAFTAGMAYWFNPAVWYNSSLWGQLESPPVFWVLLGIYLMVRKKTLYSHAAFAAAMLFKQSTLIFFPAFIIYSFIKTGFRDTLKGLALQFLIFILVYVPFVPVLNPVSMVGYPVSVYLNRIEVGSGSNYITDHAFNLWALYTRLDKIPDTLPVWNNIPADILSKSVFVLLLLLLLQRQIFSRKNSSVIGVMGLTSILAFLVLTRMHERYLAPAIPLMAVMASVSPQLWPIYFLMSLGHLINMYHNWWYPTLIWLRPVMLNWNTVIFTVIIFTVSAVSWLALYYDQTRRS